MGTTQRSWKIYACGAAVVATLLTSAACSPDDRRTGAGATPGPGTPGTTASPVPGAPVTPAATTPGGTTPGSTSSATATPSRTPGKSPTPPAGTGTPAAPAPAVCTEADLSVSASNEGDKGKPLRYILLTATNTGKTTCNVYGHPFVKLGADAQGLVPVIKDSDPGAVSTLAPGQKTYAALLATGGKMDEYYARTLTVAVQRGEHDPTAGKPVDVALPGVDSVPADDGQTVTYWMTAQGLALRFIMSR
ncbi:DUF4232 domain-containing protein [Kitasatospora sp. NPDC057223]|uniref:DUF4232 domain-containing protein n=1 Tax=Kitasatospora sp. NPDC057223 TaxID=3346055 RepID=UPI0036295694